VICHFPFGITEDGAFGLIAVARAICPNSKYYRPEMDGYEMASNNTFLTSIAFSNI
jgi:hypothetical protein